MLLMCGMAEEGAWIRQLISRPSYGPWAMRSSELTGTVRSVCGTRPPNGCSGLQRTKRSDGRSISSSPSAFGIDTGRNIDRSCGQARRSMGRVPAHHKDKRTLSIAFMVALLCSRDNQIQMIVAIVRDETARWKEDRALRQRLAELEAAIQKKTSPADIAGHSFGAQLT